MSNKTDLAGDKTYDYSDSRVELCILKQINW